jgi:hypothetical protein
MLAASKPVADQADKNKGGATEAAPPTYLPYLPYLTHPTYPTHQTHLPYLPSFRTRA